jgi:hypothetical protein
MLSDRFNMLGATSMEDWNEEELAASVKAYRQMQAWETERKKYSKVQQYRKLEAQFPIRSAKAFEYRMQNISAILHERGEAWIPGLKPAGNVGTNVKPRIEVLLSRHQMRESRGQGAAYKAKLPAMRDWLIRLAQSHRPVNYGQMREAFDIDRISHRHALDYLGHQAANLDEPILTALVVGKKSLRCLGGFAEEFGIEDDEAERQKLYQFWAEREIDVVPQSSADSFEERVARFVSVEIRPDQAAFRRRVYTACGERCVISGCDVLPALDAAHKTGRDWRKGHNSAQDGYLLRKDLHALYDAKLLGIHEDGTVWVDQSIATQYGLFSGLKCSVTARG